MLSIQAIKDFQLIYEKNYGVALSDQDARILAGSFLECFKVIYKPINDSPKLDGAKIKS